MSQKYLSLLRFGVGVIVMTAALGSAGPARAQICFPGGFHGWSPTVQTTTNGPNCLGLFGCYAPLG